MVSVNGAEGSGGSVIPLSRGFRGHSTLWKFLVYKEHLDWVKTELNAAEIITVQGYKCIKN